MTWISLIQVASPLIKFDHKNMTSNSFLCWSIIFLEYDSPQRNYKWHVRIQNPNYLKWLFYKLTIFAKHFLFGFWQGPEYASDWINIRK